MKFFNLREKKIENGGNSYPKYQKCHANLKPKLYSKVKKEIQKI